MERGTIRQLLNVRSLYFERAIELYEVLFVPVLLYGCETMVWMEKESSKIRPLRMDIYRHLLGVRRIDKVQSARIRECVV